MFYTPSEWYSIHRSRTDDWILSRNQNAERSVLGAITQPSNESNWKWLPTTSDRLDTIDSITILLNSISSCCGSLTLSMSFICFWYCTFSLYLIRKLPRGWTSSAYHSISSQAWLFTSGRIPWLPPHSIRVSWSNWCMMSALPKTDCPQS